MVEIRVRALAYRCQAFIALVVVGCIGTIGKLSAATVVADVVSVICAIEVLIHIHRCLADIALVVGV
jgi:hypothetical protein